jgi:amino acid adenylation domain-containing protein
LGSATEQEVLKDRGPQSVVSRVQALADALTLAWEETLGAPPSNWSEDFLVAGGDSLRAALLASRLSSMCETTLSSVEVLQHRTPSALVNLLAGRNYQPSSQSIDHRASETEQPLTFSQERMWFMNELAPQSFAYHIGLALRLRGPLDITALSTAIDKISDRHPVLRARFEATAMRVQWRSGPAEPLKVIRIAQPNEAEDSFVEDHVRRFVRTPFDLSAGPVFRPAVFRISDDDSVVLLLVHHIVGDQWSLDVMARDLAKLYSLAVTGRDPALPRPPDNLGEFAVWHRAWFTRERQAIELAYWHERLTGIDPLRLQTDFPRPQLQSFNGARVKIELPRDLIRTLRAIAATRGATLAMLLLAALKILLHRHTGRSDIAIGVPVANRQHANTQELVGTLVNTLVLRTNLSGDPDFDKVLDRVRDTCLGAFAHQDLPFELLVQQLRIGRDPGQAPLFGVMFNMLNTPLGPLDFHGLEWRKFDFDRGAAQFDLTVTVDAEHDCSVVFEYAADLFEPVTMRAMSARYLHLLRALTVQGSRRISELQTLADLELACLKAWETGRARPIEPGTASELLQAGLTRFRNHIALVCRGQEFRYEALDQLSGAICAELRARGVAPGDLLGICMPRSPGMLAAILGILRSGAAYVPLEPSNPEERIRGTIADSGLSIVLTTTGLAQRLGRPTDNVILLEESGVLSNRQSGPERTHDSLAHWALPAPESPAYVINTSGSTGRPKGVAIAQRALANLLLSMQEEPGLAVDDRMLAITTPAFDIAALELLLPLCVGARIILAEDDVGTDPGALGRLLRRHDVNVMQATPSLWRLLLDSGWSGDSRMRALVGGEALSTTLVERLLPLVGELWNMYGPTEATIWSTCWRVPAGGVQRISLGRPVANTRIYVLDSNARRCPIGVPGEIHIAGAGVALGYIGRPEATARNFTPDPFCESPSRIYHTGDIGRWRHDGTLEFLGRADSQIKIRGFRIELGEIENRLAAHPALAGVVLSSNQIREGDTRLIAHVVPWREMPPAEALREHLRTWLPDYMLPQHFIELDAIPLLPSGKVNYAALPSASTYMIDHSRSLRLTPPRNALERELLAIWREVLALDDIGIHDDFFDLGGHSLLAVRLAALIRERLGYPVTIPMLFSFSTIASLGDRLESGLKAEADAVITLQPHGSLAPVFCLCGIRIYQALADRLGAQRPVYGVFAAAELKLHANQPQGDDGPSVDELATLYLNLIRRRQPRGPYHLVGFSLGGAVAQHIARRLSERGEQIGLLALLDSNVPGQARVSVAFLLLRAYRLMRRLVGLDPISAPTATHASEAKGASAPFVAPAGRYMRAIACHDALPYRGPAVFVEAVEERNFTAFGWRKLVGQLEVHRLATSHLGLLQEPAVERVADILRRTLSSLD